MSDTATPRVPVWPYVLVGAAVKLVCVLLGYWYVAATGNEIPNLSTPVTILAIGTGLGWYSSRVNRSMRGSEMLLFASGTALVDLLFSVLMVVLPILWVGESLSRQNLDLASGGDGTGLTGDDIGPLGFLMLFIVVLNFGMAYFFAWLMTRKLPRAAKR